MDESIQIKKLLEDLEKQGLVRKTESSANMIKYSFANKDKQSLVGVVVTSPDFDVFYMAFEGQTNRHFASGEMLDAGDVEKFIKSAIDGPIRYNKSFFGKETISIRDIVLNEKIDE